MTWQWRTLPPLSSQLKCGQTPTRTGSSQDSGGPLSEMDPTRMGTPIWGEEGDPLIGLVHHHAICMTGIYNLVKDSRATD